MTDFGRRGGLVPHASSHKAGGTDPLSFLLLPDRKHAAKHQAGGDDVISLAGLTAPLHGNTHRYVDTDTFQVGGMLGELAHNQHTTWTKISGKPSTYPPSGHHTGHEAGGADIVDIPGYDGTPQSDDFSVIKEPLFWRHYTNPDLLCANYWDREVNAGFLTMYGGYRTNWSSGANLLNFPYQIINGDFTVETKIILPASPSANYHEAGILLMRDNSNGIKFGRAYSAGQILGLNHLIDAGDNFVSIAFSTDTLWLKVIRSGTAITCWHSINGTDWTQKSDPGSTLQTDAPLMVGPETLLGNLTHTWFVAKFEYFNFS